MLGVAPELPVFVVVAVVVPEPLTLKVDVPIVEGVMLLLTDEEMGSVGEPEAVAELLKVRVELALPVVAPDSVEVPLKKDVALPLSVPTLALQEAVAELVALDSGVVLLLPVADSVLEAVMRALPEVVAEAVLDTVDTVLALAVADMELEVVLLGVPLALPVDDSDVVALPVHAEVALLLPEPDAVTLIVEVHVVLDDPDTVTVGDKPESDPVPLALPEGVTVENCVPVEDTDSEALGVCDALLEPDEVPVGESVATTQPARQASSSSSSSNTAASLRAMSRWSQRSDSLAVDVLRGPPLMYAASRHPSRRNLDGEKSHGSLHPACMLSACRSTLVSARLTPPCVAEFRQTKLFARGVYLSHIPPRASPPLKPS